MATELGLNISLPVKIVSSSNITLQIDGVAQTYIAVSYSGPNGNDPVANNNYLFVWSGGPDLPVGAQPVASAPATAGSASIAGTYDAEEYVVGYSVGPSVTSGATTTYPSIAATAAVNANWEPGPAHGSSLGIATAQTKLISFAYALPTNVNPKQNGAWIGLWNGSVTPYDVTPLNSAPVTATSNSGYAAMTGLALTPNGTFTAALFTSGWSTDPTKLDLTTIAAVITFETQATLQS